MKRKRDEGNEKLDTVEIKKLKKKQEKSSHHHKSEVPVYLEEKLKPLDLKGYKRNSDVSKISKKHKISGMELPEMELNKIIGKTKKKHTFNEKNTSEKQAKDIDAYLFKENLKKHTISDLGFSETNEKNSIRKKTKKKHKTEEMDTSDKSDSRNLLHTTESDSIGNKKKKKHKHDKENGILQEHAQVESSDVSYTMKVKKKEKTNKDKNKKVDDHIPILGGSTTVNEPDKTIDENKKSQEEKPARRSGDEKCSKQSKKKKKKMKSEKETLKQKSDSDAKSQAQDYLNQWQSDGENWKFQKVRQVWLLHNMYNKDKIGEEDFDILLRYLEPIRGKAREQTLSEAEEIMKSVESEEEADMDKEELLKVQRARQVIQILSIEPGQ